MLTPAHLTPEEFSALHNALCSLDRALSMARAGGADTLAATIEHGMVAARGALKRVYDEEGAEFRRRQTIYSAVALEDHIKHSTWSIYEVTDMGARPFPDARMLRYDGGWGKACQFELHPNASWREIWAAADILVKRSGDAHHTFIEAVRPAQDDPAILNLSTGS